MDQPQNAKGANIDPRGREVNLLTRAPVLRATSRISSSTNGILVIGEADMGRMFVDCRDYPSEMNCTVAISADTKKEILEAAVQHAVAVHGHQDSPQLRHELEKMIKTQ